MSGVLPGESPCGRTSTRIKGWMGRADQTTKIKGMFVRPEQVAALVARHPEVTRARVVAGRAGETDTMTVRLEGQAEAAETYGASVKELWKLSAGIGVVGEGALPKDGVLIEDTRQYD